ncbi:MAG: tetratricopeptide repeat protein [Candidatus Kapaibacterium sp.]|jgi:tetratricopeptide (TPR) repeat protein
MKKYFLLLLALIMISCSDTPEEVLMNARANLNKGAYETARFHLDQIIKNDSSNCEAHLLYGRLEFEQKNFDAAIQSLNKSVTSNPDFLPAYKERAKVFRKLGLLDKAIQDLSRLLLSYADDGSIYLERGNIYFEMDMMSFACEDWLKANELGISEAKRIYDKFCIADSE